MSNQEAELNSAASDMLVTHIGREVDVVVGHDWRMRVASGRGVTSRWLEKYKKP